MKKNKEQLDRILTKVGKIPQNLLNQHLLLAVEQSEENLMELFLALGADPNIKLKDDKVVLQAVLKLGNLKTVKVFKRYGVNMRVVDLSDVVEAGFIDIVSYMLEKGAENRWVYLLIAIKKKNVKMLQCLLKHDAKINEFVMREAAQTSLELVELLLNYEDRKFPAETFYDGDRTWGYLTCVDTEVLKYVLELVKNGDTKISSCLQRDKKYGVDSFPLCLNMTLESAIKRADFLKIQLVVVFFEQQQMEISIGFQCMHAMLEGLVKNSKTTEELNCILNFLKEHNVFQSRARELLDYISIFCERASIETLKILEVEPSQKILRNAISSANLQLVNGLLNAKVYPNREEVSLAIEEFVRKADEETGERRYQILKIVIAAES